MKNVYLVHIYDARGNYRNTCEIAFKSLAAAQKYANDCVMYTEIQKVDLVGLKDL